MSSIEDKIEFGWQMHDRRLAAVESGLVQLGQQMKDGRLETGLLELQRRLPAPRTRAAARKKR